MYCLASHYAQLALSAPRQIDKRKTCREEHNGKNRGRSAQKIRRSRRTEQATGRTATKGSSHIRTFAVLHQYQHDD